ncbi:acetyl-CoA acetyltransferase [Microscilla marina]|uniref:Thiolase family protein n=1 Tax=Microscilla marina ATCC 23134 TaxID=313606 RepID=A1ZH43_MICM2|nr:acetyl-CoA acetyltransferase [Microscilla marina]EAY30312.1 thiolase family protein [Microscilla marina ATCC 23134]
MKHKVYILNGAQTDFAINWHREEKGIDEILKQAFVVAADQSQLKVSDIQCAHVGNFVGELFCGQGHLGGLFASIHPDLEGIPTARHEAACASGSMAVLAAMRDIEAGWYDLACVAGVEMMRNVDGATAANYLGAAAWVGKEAKNAQYPWVAMFSEVTDYYRNNFGLKEEHLAAIAQNNYANAQLNPLAQTQHWKLEPTAFGNDPTLNPVIEGCIRKSDCSRITDGAAVVFLASETYARKYAQQRGISFESLPYIKGWGHRTAPMLLQDKLQNKVPQGAYPFPHLHHTIQEALTRANLPSSQVLDAIETHDCFTISEYVALEHFGLAAPGEAWKVIENGSFNLGGTIPVNPSGGLIGTGHPVGATGVRMLLDAYKQVSNQAEAYQVEGAKNVGILNIGGSFTTIASFVVGV